MGKRRGGVNKEKEEGKKRRIGRGEEFGEREERKGTGGRNTILGT